MSTAISQFEEWRIVGLILPISHESSWEDTYRGGISGTGASDPHDLSELGWSSRSRSHCSRRSNLNRRFTRFTCIYAPGNQKVVVSNDDGADQANDSRGVDSDSWGCWERCIKGCATGKGILCLLQLPLDGESARW
jgi:hypothetical protein